MPHLDFCKITKSHTTHIVQCASKTHMLRLSNEPESTLPGTRQIMADGRRQTGGDINTSRYYSYFPRYPRLCQLHLHQADSRSPQQPVGKYIVE